jgi:hypothetical protein
MNKKLTIGVFALIIWFYTMAKCPSRRSSKNLIGAKIRANETGAKPFRAGE